MASSIYNSFKKEIMDGTIDLDTNTIYVILVSSDYTTQLDIDAHTRMTDVTSWEITGTGYTTGGAEITNKQVTQDDTDDEGVFDGADVTWATATVTARGAIIYKSTGATANDNLICWVDFGEDKSSSAGDFTIQWSTEGIINLT